MFFVADQVKGTEDSETPLPSAPLNCTQSEEEFPKAKIDGISIQTMTIFRNMAEGVTDNFHVNSRFLFFEKALEEFDGLRVNPSSNVNSRQFDCETKLDSFLWIQIFHPDNCDKKAEHISE